MATAVAQQRKRVSRGVRTRLAEVLAGLQAAGPDGRPLVRASVHTGHVRLSGNVATTEGADHIRRAVARVPGVAAVEDDLHDDETLATHVRTLLAASVRPAMMPRVHVVWGKVYLDWPKRDAELERDVEGVVLGTAGVRGIVHGQWSQGVWDR